MIHWSCQHEIGDLGICVSYGYIYHEVGQLVISRIEINLALPKRDGDNHITIMVIYVWHAFHKVRNS